jgi:large subunit ribosomal protein L3
MIKEILGKKIGMTQIFDEGGNVLGVTVIEVEPACLLEKISYSNKERIRIGCFKVGEVALSKVKKPQAGYFKKLGVSPYKVLKEVKFNAQEEFVPAKEVGVEIFQEGELVDVQSTSKGKGFQGGMKRHGWSGQRSSHGSTMHRRPGSIGASTYPARVVKGHRMPGHMGDALCVVKNLRVVKVDAERKMIFIEGSVPGSVGRTVSIRKIGQ